MTTAARKLATIVALDVAGYSARTEADEAKTTAEVAALRQVIEGIANAHGGRVFNTAGDGFMLEFASSLAAVEAASELAAKCEPKVRVGVHLGDVVVQPNGDLLGHGVNVAARLMARSDPGAALISADVRRTIRGPLAERLVSRGLMQLDKMTETIEAFALATVASSAPVMAKPSEPVLAVLPFDNLSDDREMQFFSDGVSEEILGAIARAKGLRVIGKASSFQLRGADKSVRKAVGELGATYVLDGSVRRSGNRVRVAAQLVDGRTLTTLWNDRFDRELNDVFQLQDELAASIAAVLSTRFTPNPIALSIDPEAYDLFLKARAKVVRDWSSVDRDESAVLLEQVIARAPGFAPAWGLLAALRVLQLPIDRDGSDEPAHKSVAAACARALQIDPDCDEAVGAQASLLPAFAHYGRKIELAHRAASLAPNDASAVSLQALSLGMVGRNRDALAVFQKCVQIDPLSSWPYALCALGLNAAGNPAAALEMTKDAAARFPDAPHVWSLRLFVLLDSHAWDEARRIFEAEHSRPASVLPAVVAGFRLFLDLIAMSQSEREPILRTLLGSSAGQPLNLALCNIAALLGFKQIAFEALFDALGSGRNMFASGGARWFTASVFFRTQNKTLRDDPRFATLCARLGLVDYWRESGHWPDCATEVPYDFKAECEKAVAEAAKP